ncbi:hypothetical protein [Hanstruepera marina]|uniref:hypothetical protein n=1 Tax=Hanstruepera marina TaxID=2873265 RepID=UPI001CA754D6|nr:hypothetical protein [Hanstruepera marina]
MNNSRLFRNTFSLFCLILLVISCSSDDDNSGDIITPQPKVFEGDVVLSSQSEVDDFGTNGYNVIDGFLFIGVNDPNSPDQVTNISDLSSLLSISSVQYGVTVYNNPQLNNLDGLNSLTYINGGALTIDSNESLVSISALTGLVSFRSLEVVGNPMLLNIDGLEGVQSSRESIIISNNSGLLNIDGLSGLRTIGGEFLFISDNESLANINGLSNLENVDRDIVISSNIELTNLNGLSSLQNVGEDIYINFNEGLVNFCGLENLFMEGSLVGSFNTLGNGFNPTSDDMVNGNCSL